jgi:hypothetical protein
MDEVDDVAVPAILPAAVVLCEATVTSREAIRDDATIFNAGFSFQQRVMFCATVECTLDNSDISSISSLNEDARNNGADCTRTVGLSPFRNISKRDRIITLRLHVL